MDTQAAHKRTFHTLDALRGLAALVVVARHAPELFLPLRAANAGLAVDLFFVISGIVLSRAYDGRLRRGLGVLGFMKLRVIRLYPLYLAGLALGALNALGSLLGHGVIGWTHETFALAVLLGLAMLPGPSPSGDGRLFPLNIPTWSLFFELAVNGLYAWLWPVLTVRRLRCVCLACVPALAVAVWWKGDLDRGVMTDEAWIGAIRTMFSFSMGVLIARTSVDHRVVRGPGPFLALVAGVGLMLLLPEGTPIRGAWDLACVLMLIPLIGLLGTRIEPPAPLVPVCTAAGLASYAIYVLHAPAVAILESLAGHFSIGSLRTGAPLSGAALLVLVALGGWVLDRAYDAPVRRWIYGVHGGRGRRDRHRAGVSSPPQAVRS